MIYKFTNRAEKAISLAQEIAAEFGHNYVGTEHLLFGLVKEGNGLAYKVLSSQGITEEKVSSLIEELIGRDAPLANVPIGFTPRTKRVIELSFIEAKKLNNTFIGTEHLLLGIMKEGDSVASRIIIHSPYKWLRASILCVSFSPQAHMRSFTPFSVHVAFFTVIHSPKV